MRPQWGEGVCRKKKEVQRLHCRRIPMSSKGKRKNLEEAAVSEVYGNVGKCDNLEAKWKKCVKDKEVISGTK